MKKKQVLAFQKSLMDIEIICLHENYEQKNSLS